MLLAFGGVRKPTKVLPPNLPLKIFTFSVVIELFIVASFARGRRETSLLHVASVLMVNEKGNPKSLSLSSSHSQPAHNFRPPKNRFMSRIVKLRMIFCECFMLMAVNFA
jgi:hypothetical protein